VFENTERAKRGVGGGGGELGRSEVLLGESESKTSSVGFDEMRFYF